MQDLEHVLLPQGSILYKLLICMGPGITVSLAFMDPGTISGEIDAGIYSGYSLLWLVVFCSVSGYYFQSLAIRLGVVTEKSLAENIAELYPYEYTFLLWISIEVAIISADMQMVLGFAIALNILIGWNLWVGMVVGVVNTLSILMIQMYGKRLLEIVFGGLMLVIVSCFLLHAITLKVSLGSIIQGTLVPYISKEAGEAAVGLVGALVLPFNLYLHSSLVLTRKVHPRDLHGISDLIQVLSLETWICMILTVIVNISIVSIFAELKDTHSSLNLMTAGEAFDALGATLWGLGLLAAGCSASLAVTLAGQHVLQGYWKLEISGWKRTLLTRSLAIAPSLLLPALIDLNKICNIHLDNKLNLIQSLNLPFVLIVLMRLCRSKKVIREFKASTYVIVLCAVSTVLIVMLNLWSVLISSSGIVIGLVIVPGFMLYMLFMYKLYTIELNTIEKYRSLKSYLTFN